MAGGKKVVVIGSGPGGYVAGIRAAQLGAEVTVVEKESPGGTCLNVGCIPTKALLASVSVLKHIQRAGEFGITVEGVTPDLSRMAARSEKIVKQLTGGIEFLFKKNGITLVKGRGVITEQGVVSVSKDDGSTEELRADSIIAAVGSIPALPGIFPFDGEKVITSTEALRLREVPGRLLIVGGGAIGLEFAYIFSAIGAGTCVVEMMDQLLPAEDADVAKELEICLRKQKIEIRTGEKIESIEVKESGIAARLSSGDELKADKVLVAIGRVPDTQNTGLRELNLLDDKGFIKVNEKMETAIPGIYAIGDAVGGLLLAHKASGEARVAAENVLGLDVKMDYNIIPRCVYTQPEIAAVGISESSARKEGREIKIGKFPFSSLGKARAMGETDGMVKIITDASSDEILGVHIIGPEASDLIGEPALAMKLEGTAEDIGRTVHAHPTLTEAIMEASHAVDGAAIHI